MSLLRNPPGPFTEKQHFTDNSNSLTGEVKHKSMRFSLEKSNILRIRIPVTRKLQVFEDVMSNV